jgi:hypothetical protein
MNGCAMSVILQTSQVQLAKMKLNKNYTLVLTVDALNFTKDIAANLPLYDINIRKYNK